MLEPWYAIEAFVHRGGPVLYGIAAVLLIMWTLILERYWYLRSGHPERVAWAKQQWSERRDHTSWHAHQIRRSLISQVGSNLTSGIGLLESLIGLCTLLGLLGTVTGMIEVFDIMALTGSSSARLMADGVSKATIPTMAGMVAALSGLYFTTALKSTARRERDRVADVLTLEQGT